MADGIAGGMGCRIAVLMINQITDWTTGCMTDLLFHVLFVWLSALAAYDPTDEQNKVRAVTGLQV